MSIDEATWRLFKELNYVYDAIGKTEDRLDILRLCADDMARSLKEFMDEYDLDYTAAHDRILDSSRGKSYKSMVKIFGLTDGAAERQNQRRLEHFERRQHIQKGDWWTSA